MKIAQNLKQFFYNAEPLPLTKTARRTTRSGLLSGLRMEKFI